MSQLLSRLRREVQSTTDAEHRAELLARISGILARMRNFDEAKQIIGELRQTYSDGRSGRVTVWIMLAEGLVLLFEKLSPAALDKITRAQALGIAMRYPTMVALASAWKAHLEFEDGTYDSMLQSIAIGLDHADDANYDAITRLAIVLCNALTICGERTESQKRFMQARELAAKNGDQPSVASLLYNRALFLVTRARAENCVTAVSPSDVRSIRMELESMRNFHSITNLIALPAHIKLWDARLQMLEGAYEAAMTQLRLVRGESPFADHNFSQSYIDLEVCFCQFKAHRIEASLADYRLLGELSFDQLDVDEQLVAAWMLWTMASEDARFGDASALAERLSVARHAYGATMKSLQAGLQRFAA